MKHLNLILALFVGFAIGNFFPLNDLLFPKSQIRLTKDYVLKAGTKAQQRHFQGSVTGVSTEINFDAGQDGSEVPRFELITNK